ncbi:hypothetical protein [Nocardioides sp. zg-1230]|uniref:hypothetical protein n=1 Tax=Nocardioides sp. zg-1230 TaxID=2736601 RepID=UPI001555C71D|nr:hypothetical protein [Nocardioides sp. zg-1230]NPC41255.1 hypothetical protein [Nocardioides sp. zg-1230]
MITWARAPRPGADGRARQAGNASDLLYLEGAVAALAPIMAVCAGATRSTRPEVRALAREALSLQVDRCAEVSAVLHGWGGLEAASPPVAGPEVVAEARGEALDRLFVDRLIAYTHASLIRSRAELVAGANRPARLLAERAIHADDRQLARLRTLVLVQARPADAPVVHESMARWSDDGGSWQRPSPTGWSSPGGA